MLSWKSKGGEIEGKEKLVGLSLKLSLSLRSKDYFPGDTVFGAAFIYISRPENFSSGRSPAKKAKFSPTEVASISILVTGKQYIQLGVRERSLPFYHQQVVLYPPQANLPMPVDPTSPPDETKGTAFVFSGSENAPSLDASTAAMRESIERKKFRQACLTLQKNGSYIYPFRFALPGSLPWTDVVYTPPSTDIRGTCRYFVTLILELKNGKRYKSLRSFFLVRPLPVPLARWETNCDPDSLDMPEVEEVDSDEDPEEAEALRKSRVPLSNIIHSSAGGRRRSSKIRRRRSSGGMRQHIKGEGSPSGENTTSPLHIEGTATPSLENMELPDGSEKDNIFSLPTGKPLYPMTTTSSTAKKDDEWEMTSLNDLRAPSAPPTLLENSAVKSRRQTLQKTSIMTGEENGDLNSPDEQQVRRRRRRKTRQMSLSGAADAGDEGNSGKKDSDSPIHVARLSQAFVSRSSKGSLFYSHGEDEADSSQTEQMRVLPHHRRPSGMRHRPMENDDDEDSVRSDLLSARHNGDPGEEGPSRQLRIRHSSRRFSTASQKDTFLGADALPTNGIEDTKEESHEGKNVQLKGSNGTSAADSETVKRGRKENVKISTVKMQEFGGPEEGTKGAPANDGPDFGTSTDIKKSPQRRSKSHRKEESGLQDPETVGEPALSPSAEVEDDEQSITSFDVSRAQPRYCREDGTGSPPASHPSTPMRLDKKRGLHQAALNALDEDTESGLEMVYSISIRSSIIKKASANVPVRLNSVVLVPGQELLVELILDAKKGPQLSHLTKIKANLCINGSFKCPAKEKYTIILSSATTGTLDWKGKKEDEKRIALKLFVPMHSPLCIISENWKVRAAVELQFVNVAVLKDYVTTICMPVVIVCGVIGRSLNSRSRRLLQWTNNFMHMGINSKMVKKAGQEGDPFVGIQPVLYQGQRRLREADPHVLNTYIEACIAPQPLKTDPSKGATVINPMLGVDAAARRANQPTPEPRASPGEDVGANLAPFLLWAGGKSGGSAKAFENSDEDISDEDEEEDLLKYDLLIRVVGDDDPSIVTFLPETKSANLASDYKAGMPLPDSQHNPLF